MSNAVFYHKPNSIYDDDPARKYHFPKSYLSRVQKTLDDWIVYYGPLNNKKGRFYTAIARTTCIESDPNLSEHYYVFLEDYIDFDRPLRYTENGGYEKKLFKENGLPNGGYTQQSVRYLEIVEFQALIEAGFSENDTWPPRYDGLEENDTALGFEENTQASIAGMFVERPIVQQIVNRPFREAKFRQHIRQLYDRRCAFTSLRLINGQGRPEVEAAHIIPVEQGGNDSVQNGLALSGTVHWMFDRGLLSLTDDYEILASRHLNYDVSHLLNSDMKAIVPKEHSKRPHPEYLAWHRNQKFKA
ncbi:HNH endonuclease [Roseibium album]|uniref:HNH endonuclease n=1 Tax=Roseibium album TaxID=311410 RepID=UPI002492B2DA|nr:HNH endonuclease [Roseibium album]